jgi:hypothetical protein
MSWFSKLWKAFVGVGANPAVRPRSGNGASSFHLTWDFPFDRSRPEGFSEVSAVLEIQVPPGVGALYFWALQVDFVAGGRALGGGHTGLQWNARYPRHKAVNWGGYASSERGGFVLPGSQSALEGFSDDPNTLAFAWQPDRPYRLRVFRSPDTPGAWRSEVTDVSTGRTDTVRDVLPEDSPGDPDAYLLRPVVWSEVFAECDEPSVTVRWSDLQAVDRAGGVVRPRAVIVNYQAWEAGGCPNTTVDVDGAGGLLQITNTQRRVSQGASLEI